MIAHAHGYLAYCRWAQQVKSALQFYHLKGGVNHWKSRFAGTICPAAKIVSALMRRLTIRP
jgi:hypothetical protein